jgi:DNA-binding response OmpR family regulator
MPATYAVAPLSSEFKLPEFDPDRKVILIVEDNPESALMYCRYLSAAQFQPHAVSTVAEAERFIGEIRPSAVILDLMLASDTTWELLKKIKSHKEPVPVLVLSAIDDPNRVFEAGADCYLVKPFAPDQMVTEIRRLTTVERRLRILLIDDSEVARYLLRSEIPEASYEVFEARDGVEGLRMAQELKPEMIFLDFYMPDLNGAEVLRHLKNTESLSNIRVVLHSTKTLSDKETAYFNENSVSIFSKQSMTLPDSGSSIRKLVKQLTQKPSAEDQ